MGTFKKNSTGSSEEILYDFFDNLPVKARTAIAYANTICF